MRTLCLVLLFLAAPLAAQEQKEKKTETGQDRQADTRRLVRQLASRDPAKRKQAEDQLRALTADQLVAVLREAFRKRDVSQAAGIFELRGSSPSEVRILVGGPWGSEVIRGSDEETSWTLKSTGNGRYQLTAKQRDRKIEDRGTLKELKEKYAFLKGAFVMQVDKDGDLDLFTFSPRPGLPSTPPPAPQTVAVVGLIVRPPSEELRYHLALPAGAGLVVQHVVAGSRAERIGLKRYDVLKVLDGEVIDAPGQLAKLQAKQGQLEIVRRGKPRTLDLAKAAAARDR